MSMVKRFVRQLEIRGLRIEPGAEPDQLLLCGPKEQKTPEVMAAVKKFKPQLLELYGVRAKPDLDDAGRPDAIATTDAEPP